MLKRESFLGCSIRSFNANIGWGNTATVLNVGLVEDPKIGQKFGLIQEGDFSFYFDPFELIGQLVRFQYDQWIFDGILSNIYEKKSHAGNRVFEVNLGDPRDLLDGVQLILGGYTGSTYNVPNIYNIFGYLENQSFGNSDVNDSGIPWTKVFDTFIELNAITPIYLAGVPYTVDLSLLPRLPYDYRIATNNMSLLAFIQESCEMSNYEFTAILVGNIIKIITINRNAFYAPGSISRFLNSIQTPFVELENGIELEYNTTNKFLVGGQVEQIYFQNWNQGPVRKIKSNTPLKERKFAHIMGPAELSYIEYSQRVFANTDSDFLNVGYTTDDTIAQYWGTDVNGNAITAYIENDIRNGNPTSFQQFFLNGSAFGYPYYPTSTEELERVVNGKTDWEFFLQVCNNLAYPPTVPPGLPVTKFTAIKNIHQEKYTLFNIDTDFSLQLVNSFRKPLNQVSFKDIVKLNRSKLLNDQKEYKISKIYEYLKTIYDEYYFKKFMVRIPYVLSKKDAHTNEIRYNLEPTDSGYIEESLFSSAVANGLMPNDTDFVTNSDNKIVCYARFGPFNFERLNLSEIPESDYYFSGPYLFVKCELDPKLVFINKTNNFSPRAVITLPGRVRVNEEKPIMLFESFWMMINGITAKGPDWEKKKEEFDKWLNKAGKEYAFLFNAKDYCLSPNLVAIPLRNNTTTYGPWYSLGAQGKVEFDQNNDIVPWNFGGFENMNNVGLASVQNVYSNNTVGESGSVQLPGVPALSIASQLISGGPFVNNVDVSIGDQGVTTTYRMGRFNLTYGRQINYNIEMFKKIYSIKREQARAFRSLYKTSKGDSKNISAFIPIFPEDLRRSRRHKPTTSNSMLIGTLYEKGSSGVFSSDIVSMPAYHYGNIANNEWDKTFGCSLDAIFRPFSTDYNASGVPHYENPSGYTKGGISGARLGQAPTVEELNPYKVDNDISSVIFGEEEKDINNYGYGASGNYRSLALKGPIVIAGWGYDTDEKLVGNIKDQSTWKVGPLDARWDNVRKVWVAGGGPKRYLRDFRTLPDGSGGLMFQLEVVNNESGTWSTWFTAGNCV